MATGKWFHFPPLPIASCLCYWNFFFIFRDVSPLGDGDKTVQAMMAFELAVSQELNLPFS